MMKKQEITVDDSQPISSQIEMVAIIDHTTVLDDIVHGSSAELIENSVSHSPQQNQNKITHLIKDFGKVSITRVISLSCYSIAFQMFIRENQTNLLLAADFSNMNNIANVCKELLRFITNETKLAVENGSSEQLSSIFLVGHIGALPATGLTWAACQTYALILPFLGRDATVSQQLKLIPTFYLGNALLIQILSAEANYAYGRNQVLPMMFSYTLGGIGIVSAYIGLQQVISTIDGFMAANFIQSTLNIGSYWAYLQAYHPQERLIQKIFDYNSYLSALKRALPIMKSGLQPASILMIEVVTGTLINVLMREKKELACYQALQIIPIVFAAMTSTLETRIAVHTIESCKRHQKNPEALKKDLNSLMLHSSWVGNALPVGFLITCLLINDELISLLIKSSDENAAIIEAAKHILPLVAVIPVARMLRSAPYGVVTGFKQSKDLFHQQQNRYATIINSLSATTSLLIGVSLDYGLGWGAYGYCLSITTSLTVSWLGQVYLARQSINHEAQRIQQINPQVPVIPPQPKLSSSWFGFLSGNSRTSQVTQAKQGLFQDLECSL